MAEPNRPLTDLIAEAGISWAGLARRINDLATCEGLALRYDYTAVGRWVKLGQRPRAGGGIVPRLIAEVLTEKIGRTITPADIGMGTAESLASLGLQYPREPDHALSTFRALGKADSAGGFAAPFIAAALAAPSRDWLLSMLDEVSTPRQVGLRQVAGIREMFAVFQELDVMRGGGHARAALISYMDTTVVPLLKTQQDADVQKQLFEAAAEQAYLIGWMAYDDGEHGLAQRYLIQALRLSQAAENPILGAHILAGMSDQANLLGHPHEAVALARAGRAAVSVSDSAACVADLYILEARALATLGDRAAVDRISQGEKAFSAICYETERGWAKYIDQAYFFGEAALSFQHLGDTSETARYAQLSIADCEIQQRARRGALSQAALATSEAQRGETAAAAARGLTVIELADSVNSARARESVAKLGRTLTPFTKEPEVQEFIKEAASTLGIRVG